MVQERLQRRLAAILSVDVVGYSRLMGMDEAGTLSRLNALRRELINPAFAAHSGRIVKLMGDGALVEFSSAVDAVSCAIEIQGQLQEREGRGEADPIRFRIGINVATLSSKGMTFSATASISRHASKASPNPAVSRFLRTPGGRCTARWRPTSSIAASRA
jgi:class 3 adenylate cyclase